MSPDRQSDLLFGQYRVFVESALSVTQWRHSANSYLLTANALLVTVYGAGHVVGIGERWHAAVAAAGVILALSWLALIRSHKKLNIVKFAIIEKMERDLPAHPFTEEWEVLGRDRVYGALAGFENQVPVLFGALHVAVLVTSVLGMATGGVP
jgi:hypothetical protein